LPEHGNPEWTPYRQRRWTVKSHSQEMGENSVDAAHFLSVHGTLGVPELTAEVTPEGVFHAVNRSRNKRFGRVVETAVDIRLFFPGYSVIRFNELAEVMLLASNTPVDEETVEQTFLFSARRRGNPLLRSLVSWLFMREVARQYEQDKPIWENKIHLPRPVLCDGDGPIWQYRKWFQRFYPAQPIGGTKLAAH
jgi:hypothetical protein